MSWKFTDELSITFQSSVSGAGECGHSRHAQKDSLPFRSDSMVSAQEERLKNIVV